MKEEIDLRKKYLNATEEYIVAVYFLNNISHLNAVKLWMKQEIYTTIQEVKQQGWQQ